MLAAHKRQALDVLPENWHAVRVFTAMGTQWRVAAGGRRLVHSGLDYSALPVVMASLRNGLHARPLADLLPQLRIMEGAAMDILNKAD